jgi:hypothetical protein
MELINHLCGTTSLDLQDLRMKQRTIAQQSKHRYHILRMKELRFIDPVSTAKITALLGVLWALLEWLFGGIALSILIRSTAENLGDLPPAFSISGLLSGIIGGVIGGAITGYLGSYVYNFLADKVGGVLVSLEEGVVEVPGKEGDSKGFEV